MYQPVISQGLQDRLLLALAGMLLGALLAVVAGARPGWRLPAAALSVVSASAWLVLDRHFEGTVLVRLGENHGVVVADLLTLPSYAVAVAMLRGEHRDRRGRSSQAPGGPRPSEDR